MFIWLLLEAAHKDTVDTSGGRAVALRRGQVRASIAQTVAGCILSPREVRTSFATLEREGMITRDDVTSVITITKYWHYQRRPGDTEGEDPGKDAPNPETGRQAKRQGKRQSETGKSDKAKKDEKTMRDKGKTPQSEEGATKPKPKKRQGERQGKRHASINKDEETSRSSKKILPPQPPASGGRSGCFGFVRHR